MSEDMNQATPLRDKRDFITALAKEKGTTPKTIPQFFSSIKVYGLKITQSAFEQMFDARSGTGYAGKGQILDETHLKPCAEFLVDFAAKIGARELTVEEARALWNGSSVTFKERLKPLSPWQWLLKCKGATYTPKPHWDLDGYQRQSMATPGNKKPTTTVWYHPSVRFHHKFRFEENGSLKKSVFVLYSAMRTEDREETAEWKFWMYNHPDKIFARNVKREQRWPDHEDTVLHYVKSNEEDDIWLYRRIDTSKPDPFVWATRVNADNPRKLVCIALAWNPGALDKYLGEDRLTDLASRDRLTPNNLDEIATAFKAAWSDGRNLTGRTDDRGGARGRAELCRGEIAFALNGLREKPD